jgi:hypothetical protein
MKKYVPISCAFVDIIEHYATLGEPVEIQFLNKYGEQQVLKCLILDWINNGQAEYIKISTQPKQIRMDNLISIEDHKLQSFC